MPFHPCLLLRPLQVACALQPVPPHSGPPASHSNPPQHAGVCCRSPLPSTSTFQPAPTCISPRSAGAIRLS
eukprot:13925393-Alexandrium_andersonii.AAC.1